MSRFVLGLALVAVVGFTRGDDAPVAVRVVTPDGKPAAGVKVWVYGYAEEAEAGKEPEPRVADAAGELTVPGGSGGRRTRMLFARDAAGRIGLAWVEVPWEEPEDAAGRRLEVVLVDTAARTGRVMTADGKPIAGADVTPLGYYSDERRPRGSGGPSTSISLPAWEQARLAVKTDAEGRFRFPTPAAGYSVYYRVKADGFGESQWSASAGVDPDTPLVVPGAVTITVTGVDPATLKDRSWRLEAKDDTAGRGVRPSRWRNGGFDGSAKIVVPDLVPGKYELTVWEGGKVPGVFEKPAAVEVTSGKTADIPAKFGPAAKISGTITDKDGKGVGKVPVVVNVSDGSNPNPSAQFHVETDEAGKYEAHGPAGWYSIWFQTLPDGYAEPVPTGPRRQFVEPAKLEVGKAHTFPPIALLTAVIFSGQVVRADGKPAVGATVDIGGFALRGRGGKVTADKDGNFAIPNLAPDDAVAPRVRFGKAVNVPETFALEKFTRPVTIEVSEANAAAFRGRVVDAKGRPIAGAKVSLRQMVMGVGRNSSYGGYGSATTTTTDAAGRYEFTGQWPRDTYQVTVSAPGYSEAESKQLRGEVGGVHDFRDVTLARAGLVVKGVVVGPDGKPVAGAEVFSVDGPTRSSTTSATDGSFTLAGFYEGGGFVLARKAGFRLAAAAVTPGDAKPVTVALAAADGRPVPPPDISPAHTAALDAFTRHILTLIWEAHPTFGYGGNALADMARIDPATARKWRDEEKKRTDGKKDFTHLIDRAERQKTLLDTARTDPDEAVAVVAALKADDGFTEAVRVGERLLAEDKAKALRFAEEAVVKARQRDLPARIWALAQAGDLAVRCGGAAGGKKVLAEAADLAAKLGPDDRGRNSLAVGLAAAYTAPHDWGTAESLLNTVKDGDEFNRYISAAAARIARTDLARAKQLLDRFKPANTFYPQEARVRIAYAVAADQPDEAVKLIDGVKEGPYRFQGYLGLATRFHKTDPARAVRMIDTAFDFLERNPEAFASWGGSDRARMAAAGAVRAKEVGYPDVPHLVARCLALRAPGEDGRSSEDRHQRAVGLAALLAFVDPATARQVLATVAGPEEFVNRATTQRRDWLFALALADPARATILADKLIERAKETRGGRNGLSETGLVELASVLVAPDRLREFGHFGSFFREIGDDD